MSRHPYTYAADYIRHLAGYGKEGTKLSRADASTILAGIAKALGDPDHSALAEKLSIYYQRHEMEFAEEGAKAFVEAVVAKR